MPPLPEVTATPSLLHRIIHERITYAWLFSLGLLCVGTVLADVGIHMRYVPPPLNIPWWELFGLFLAGWMMSAVYKMGPTSVRVSIYEIPAALALSFDRLPEIIPAVVFTIMLMDLFRRIAPVKTFYNMCVELLNMSILFVMYRLLATPGDPTTLRSIIVLVAVLSICQIPSLLSLTIVISIATGRWGSDNFIKSIRVSNSEQFIDANLGACGVILYALHPYFLILLAVPTVGFIILIRTYTQTIDQQEQLYQLRELTSALAENRDLTSSIPAYVHDIAAIFQAHHVLAVLQPAVSGSSGVLISRVDSDPVSNEETYQQAVSDAVPAEMESVLSALAIAPHGSRRVRESDPFVQDLLQTYSRVEQGILTPISIHGQMQGFLLIARMAVGRRTDNFTKSEVVLLDTLAHQTSLTFEHGNLIESVATLIGENETLAEKTQRDTLTELSNKQHFQRCVQQALTQLKAHQLLAVVYLDLDNFKQVNDGLGHAAGDTLLINVATKLRESLRPSDVAARLGGDEFCVLLTHLATADVGERVVDRIFRAITDQGIGDGENRTVSVSIGIAFCSDPSEDPDILIGNADEAMYRSKRLGKGTTTIYGSGDA